MTGDLPWYQAFEDRARLDRREPPTSNPKAPSMSEHEPELDRGTITTHLNVLEERQNSFERTVIDSLSIVERRLDGFDDSLESRITTLANAQATHREELGALLAQVEETLGRLQATVALGRRLEKLFAPLLANTDELKSDELASKAYVDAACVKVSQALREYTRRMIDGTLQAMERALDAPVASKKTSPKSKTKATAASKRKGLPVSTRRR